VPVAHPHSPFSALSQASRSVGRPACEQSASSPDGHCTARARDPGPHCALHGDHAAAIQRQSLTSWQGQLPTGTSDKQSCGLPDEHDTFLDSKPVPHRVLHSDQSSVDQLQPEVPRHVLDSAGFWAAQDLPEQVTARVSTPPPQSVEHAAQGPTCQTQPNVSLQKSAARGATWPQSALSPDGQKTCRKRMPLPQDVEQLSQSVTTQEQLDLSSQNSRATGAGLGQSLTFPEGQATGRERLPWPHLFWHSPQVPMLQSQARWQYCIVRGCPPLQSAPGSQVTARRACPDPQATLQSDQFPRVQPQLSSRHSKVSLGLSPRQSRS